MSYIYILIPSYHCFQANFQEFCSFPAKNVEIIAIYERK
mgnify:FL=1